MFLPPSPSQKIFFTVFFWASMLFSNVMCFVNYLFYGCEHTPLKLGSLKQLSFNYYLKYYRCDMWTGYSGFEWPQLRMTSAWQDRLRGLPVQHVMKMCNFVYELARLWVGDSRALKKAQDVSRFGAFRVTVQVARWWLFRSHAIQRHILLLKRNIQHGLCTHMPGD